MIARKPWGSLLDTLADYMCNRIALSILIAKQERLTWPWSMNDVQTQEWDAACRRLEPMFTPAANLTDPHESL